MKKERCDQQIGLVHTSPIEKPGGGREMRDSELKLEVGE